jgi:transcriptional regulator with XRE-family HTH domain
MTSHKRRDALKRRLKRNGWTQEAAAAEAGVTFEHLNLVLNGRRTSARLIEKLEALPARGKAKA